MDKSIFETYAGLEGRELLSGILRDFAGRAAVVSSFGAESAVPKQCASVLYKQLVRP